MGIIKVICNFCMVWINCFKSSVLNPIYCKGNSVYYSVTLLRSLSFTDYCTVYVCVCLYINVVWLWSWWKLMSLTSCWNNTWTARRRTENTRHEQRNFLASDLMPHCEQSCQLEVLMMCLTSFIRAKKVTTIICKIYTL